MYIEKLVLKNYRNYAYETFEFCNGVNIISGFNAQGKTNAAEAIFYLCTGYSPRAGKEKQVIKYDSDSASISANAFSAFGSVSARIEFDKTDGKKIFVNDMPLSKTGELLGNINAVMFNPQQLKLVQESPEDRRRFMDIALSQMSRKYFYALLKYRKILQQRNGLLKEKDVELIKDTLPVWDEQLCLVAADIICARNEFLTDLKPFSKQAHFDITDGREKLEISSEQKFEGGAFEVKEQLKTKLSEVLDKDIELGYTSVGPHRDDIKIKINDADARVFASQGQQRTAALSLKIGELQILKKHFGEYPVFILDDAMSELDKKRQKRLLSMLDGIQTIITCTDAEDILNANAKLFVIENGSIVKNDFT